MRRPRDRLEGAAPALHALAAASSKGKLRQKLTTAIGRELLGFIWAIGVQIEKEQRLARTSARAA